MEAAVVVLAVAVGLLAIALAMALRRQGSKSADLARASEQLLTLAEQRFARQAEAAASDLTGKKALIDQRLEQMGATLQQVTTFVQGVEKERAGQFSALSTQLKLVGEQTAALTTTTSTLREALSSTRARGQWGERMADDILRLIGFVEGVNYRKQAVVEGAGSRPDFVFLLPGGLRMNMDVKFPLDNYLGYLAAQSDGDREARKAAFLRDVRARVREVTGREYIDPEGGTVDYVLLFIPNESLYAFIHEQDTGVLDAALRSRVICCSPMTLFAVLAVVRQAVDTFALQRESEQIVALIGRFNEEWAKFNGSLELIGRRLASTQKAFDEAVGPRKRRLQRPLDRIEALRQQRGIDVAPGEEPDLALVAADISDEKDS
ncbi:MAG: DNA recombination protein RmuC [SAR202 cluster bacterium]|nr:DNA recombination protein RmuC [SAR202 cluster bacterium]